MHSQSSKTSGSHPPKILARACLSCRLKKVRCDMIRPRCTACITSDRECVYQLQASRRRPTIAQINDLQQEKSVLESFINNLKNATAEERQLLLTSTELSDRLPHTPTHSNLPNLPVTPISALQNMQTQDEEHAPPLPNVTNHNSDDSSDQELDLGPFISVDEAGKANSFGPSSALHFPTKQNTTSTQSSRSLIVDNVRNSLIANAALSRQNEHNAFLLPNIEGVPTELALHLLDVHWNRQHHTLLLTYRPAIMRDLLQGGPHCSKFLLNALFACSSKYSQRIEVRDDPAIRGTAGGRFFRRCDELLAEEKLLVYPSIPTVIGLLLLGLSFNSQGETSKGWLYSGYALRMVYDLGLHLDPEKTNAGPEEVEIRRRVFWGAFICDKLQSLYLGRPVAINLRDAHVSTDFMDTIEEREPWMPYSDPKIARPRKPLPARPSIIHSVSTFQQFCSLSKIMTNIINKFYVVGATFSNAKASLQLVDNALQSWKVNLPAELQYEPSLSHRSLIHHPTPNVMVLHGVYHALIILLHRPFISDGHLRSTTAPEQSWKRCTAAAKSITSISLAYEECYASGGPYMLAYSVYVACTIHVRNAAAESNHSREHSSLLAASLRCLEELSAVNPGVTKAVNIIKRLMAAKRLNINFEDEMASDHSVASFDLEAILSMFPTRNSTNNMTGDGANVDGPYDFDMALSEDPLYGFMDCPTMPFTDASEFLFSRPVTP